MTDLSQGWRKRTHRNTDSGTKTGARAKMGDRGAEGAAEENLAFGALKSEICRDLCLARMENQGGV